jgi:hypothetical protein
LAIVISIAGDALKLHVKAPTHVAVGPVANRSAVRFQQLRLRILSGKHSVVSGCGGIVKLKGEPQGKYLVARFGHKAKRGSFESFQNGLHDRKS